MSLLCPLVVGSQRRPSTDRERAHPSGTTTRDDVARCASEALPVESANRTFPLHVGAGMLPGSETCRDMDLEERLIRESIAECTCEAELARMGANWEKRWKYLGPDHPFRFILADAIQERRVQLNQSGRLTLE